jgi:hypothetical protein
MSMKDILQDVIKHTHGLGFLPLLKINGTDTETKIDSMAEDRSVILQAQTKTPYKEMVGTYGLPQLNKLDLHLKCPEYQKDAKITIDKQNRNGEDVPVGISFSNLKGDFVNSYRFMNAQIINEKLKTIKFKGANWDVELKPSVAGRQRLAYQAMANSEETTFVARTEGGNLIFQFGDTASHSGEFVFAEGVQGTLDKNWAWPLAQITQILKLADSGDCTMSFSNQGAMQISIDSGLGVYNYIIPAQAQ